MTAHRDQVAAVTDLSLLFWKIERRPDGVKLWRMEYAGEGVTQTQVLPARSARHITYSPGYGFGYDGSGPRQLALCLLLDATLPDFAVEHHVAFMADFIRAKDWHADRPIDKVMEFTVTALQVLEWAGARLAQEKRATRLCDCGSMVPTPMLCIDVLCGSLGEGGR